MLLSRLRAGARHTRCALRTAVSLTAAPSRPAEGVGLGQKSLGRSAPPPRYPHRAAFSSQALADMRWECVMFDKDGTLFDGQGMTAVWARHMASRLQEEAGNAILECFESSLGINLATGVLDPHGALALRPWADIYARLTALLKNKTPLSLTEAAMAVQRWRHELGEPGPVRQLCNVRGIFEALKESDIKIAITTVDDRRTTEAVLHAHGLVDYVDWIVAGDDAVAPKPHADNARMICSALSVDPSKCISVGDAVADPMLARTAKLGLGVGVLTGVSSVVDLQPYADVIVPTADAVVRLARGDFAGFLAAAVDVPALSTTELLPTDAAAHDTDTVEEKSNEGTAAVGSLQGGTMFATSYFRLGVQRAPGGSVVPDVDLPAATG